MGVVQWKVYDQQSNDTMVVTDMCTVLSPVTTISLNLQSLFVGAAISPVTTIMQLEPTEPVCRGCDFSIIP